MLLSMVIPVFNEAETLDALLARLSNALAGLNWEVIFVDDGSTDGSLDIIRRVALDDDRVKAIGFSRNFGHQTAVTAGLDFADGDAVVVMDADLPGPSGTGSANVGVIRTGIRRRFSRSVPCAMAKQYSNAGPRRCFIAPCDAWWTGGCAPMWAISVYSAGGPFWPFEAFASSTGSCAA